MDHAFDVFNFTVRGNSLFLTGWSIDGSVCIGMRFSKKMKYLLKRVRYGNDDYRATRYDIEYSNIEIGEISEIVVLGNLVCCIEPGERCTIKVIGDPSLDLSNTTISTAQWTYEEYSSRFA